MGGVVAIDVHFNITGFGGKNITNLRFKRTKYCDKGIYYFSVSPVVRTSVAVILGLHKTSIQISK